MKPLRRAGLISDIHGNDTLLALALEFLAHENVDAVLCPGDVVDGPGDVNCCCELLQSHNALVVRGNHDRWFLSPIHRMRELPDATPDVQVNQAARDYLASLAPTLTVPTVAGDLLLCHGIGPHDMANLKLDDFGYALEANLPLQELLQGPWRFAVGGHTHRRMARRFSRTGRERLTFINPGALLQKHEPSFAVADFEAGQVKFFEFISGGVTVDDFVEL